MPGFDDPDFYGERWADGYDEQYADLDASAAVDFLVGLAGDGRALELGIGTGRVALPLGERGVRVAGVDASAAMLARLRDKPGGRDIPVTLADFADVPVEGTFRLVYLVANTLFGLLTQDRQVGCMAAVARALEPDGCFVLECFVPDLARFERGQRVQTLNVGEDSARYELSRHDAVSQRVTTQVVTVQQSGLRLQPVMIRYAWPTEIDLMARLAGLRLRDRYADWDRRPFDASSTKHVSVYECAKP